MELAGDEFFIFLISIALSIWALFRLRIAPLHQLFFKDNPGIGYIRVAVILSLIWLAFVLAFFADESVEGIYVWFYLVMGYAVTRNFGQVGLEILGLRLRVDVYERKNLAAAIVFAAFTLCTGLIFGGSLWGEADAVGDDEGGWWIPLAFFLMGWGCLMVVLMLYLIREAIPFTQNIRQERNIHAARAVAAYLLSAAAVLTEAVAGDFFGWWQSIMSFATLAGLLVVHEIFHTLTHKHIEEAPEYVEDESAKNRWFEIAMYFAVAFFSWLLNRLVLPFL